MLKKLILTAVLSSVTLVVSYASFAQGVSWTGRYRPYLTSATSKDGEGKDRTSTYIAGTARTTLNYSSAVVDGWQATATIGLNWTNADARDADINHNAGGVSAGRNFNVTVGNESFGVSLGTTQYLAGVANTGGTFSGYNAGINAEAAFETGDLSSRIGSIGFDIKAIPDVVLKFGFGTNSTTKLYDASGDPASGSDKNAEAKEWTQTEFGLVVRYDHADFSAGLMYLSSETNKPAYNKLYEVDASGNPIRQTGIEEADRKSARAALALGGNYNLASVGAPVNLWLIYLMDGRTTDGDKDGKGFTQINLGADFDYGVGSATLSYAMSTFDQPDSVSGSYDAATETNILLVASYDMPWGTTAFFNYGTSAYVAPKVGGVEDKSANMSASQFAIGLTQGF